MYTMDFISTSLMWIVPKKKQTKTKTPQENYLKIHICVAYIFQISGCAFFKLLNEARTMHSS